MIQWDESVLEAANYNLDKINKDFEEFCDYVYWEEISVDNVFKVLAESVLRE